MTSRHKHWSETRKHRHPSLSGNRGKGFHRKRRNSLSLTGKPKIRRPGEETPQNTTQFILSDRKSSRNATPNWDRWDEDRGLDTEQCLNDYLSKTFEDIEREKLSTASRDDLINKILKAESDTTRLGGLLNQSLKSNEKIYQNMKTEVSQLMTKNAELRVENGDLRAALGFGGSMRKSSSDSDLCSSRQYDDGGDSGGDDYRRTVSSVIADVSTNT